MESGLDLGPRNFDQFKKAVGQKVGTVVHRGRLDLKRGEKLVVLEHDLNGGNTVVVKRTG